MKKPIIYLALIFITLLVLLCNFFPNYWAYINTPAGKTFTGQASWFDPWDINLYVAAIKSGQTNGLLLNNMYTTTPNNPILFYPLYTFSGLLFQNINPFLIFHLFAAVFGTFLILTIWKITAVFLKNPRDRLVALFLTITGGGIGWLVFPNFSSADLFITSFTYHL